ncbi:MAG TPA: DinB family protein [Dehalococcoidia bacterium]
MAEKAYPRLGITRHWSTMNDHLIDLVGLIPDDKFEWSPREGEWSFKSVLQHLILARFHGPIMDGRDHGAEMSAAIAGMQTKDGVKEQLRHSWTLVSEFLSDQARLDAEYDPHAIGDYDREPHTYDGHYVAYHRLAHDLHHRGTVLDYLGLLGISLDGLMIRPL